MRAWETPGPPCGHLVSVSQGCRNKLPQTQWLNAAEIYHVMVLEARSPRSGCSHGVLTVLALEGNLPGLLHSFWGGWQSHMYCLTNASPQFLRLSSHGLLSVLMCLCPNLPVLRRGPVTLDLEPTPIQYDLI